MALLIFALLLALPFLELWTIIAASGQVGAGWTIVALAALSLSGLVLLRSQGLVVWRRANADLAAGRMPTRSLVDGAMVLLGGSLLIVPGFLTAAVGLLLILPPTRALFRPLILRWMERRAARGGMTGAVFIDTAVPPFGGSRTTRSPWGTVIGGTVVDVEASEATAHAEVVDVHVDRPRELGPPR